MNIKPAIPTLANINEFSPGEIISFVGINMLKQGCMSTKYGACKYRGDNGTKCAVGFLIPDDIYTPRLEGYTNAKDLIAELCRSELKDIIYDLLDELQTLHDTAIKPWQMLHDSAIKPWREGLLDIALEYSCHDEVLKAFQEAGV